MLKLSKTSSPQKNFDYDCVTLYSVYPVPRSIKQQGEKHKLVLHQVNIEAFYTIHETRETQIPALRSLLPPGY